MPAQATRKRTSLSIDADVMAAAKELQINASRAAEEGIAAAVKSAREAKWKRDNAELIKALNEDIEKNGLPLAELRQF